MSTTVEPRVRAMSPGGVRWGRVVVAALLLELALVVVLVPIGLIFGEPFIPGSSETGDYTVFFTAVPLACLVFGYVAGMLVVRKASAHVAAHGLLVGVIATAIYLLLCLLQDGGLPAVIAGYGAMLFWATQTLRIVGCTAGAVLHGKAIAI